MKNQVEILEELFKIDSFNLGSRVAFQFTKSNQLVTRLTIGDHHSQFIVPWDRLKECYDWELKEALLDLKILYDEQSSFNLKKEILKFAGIV